MRVVVDETSFRLLCHWTGRSAGGTLSNSSRGVSCWCRCEFIPMDSSFYNSPGRCEGETHGSDAIALEVVEVDDEVDDEEVDEQVR